MYVDNSLTVGDLEANIQQGITITPLKLLQPDGDRVVGLNDIVLHVQVSLIGTTAL